MCLNKGKINVFNLKKIMFSSCEETVTFVPLNLLQITKINLHEENSQTISFDFYFLHKCNC